MSFELIRDALESQKDENDNNIFSDKKESLDILRRLIRSLINRSDFNLEVFQIFKELDVKNSAITDLREAIRVCEFIETFWSLNTDQDRSMLQSKITILEKLT